MKPSGAQGRKQRKSKDESDRMDRARLAGFTATAEQINRDAFADVHPPPSDSIGVVAWAHQIAARLLYVTIKDPSIGEAERRRTASDLISKIGQTAPKAISDQRLKRLEAETGNAPIDDADDGLSLDERPPRPHRAGANGLDEVPAPPVGADPSEQ